MRAIILCTALILATICQAKTKYEAFQLEDIQPEQFQAQQTDNICKLRKKLPGINFPSLKTCNTFSRNSCCTSLNDKQIQSKLDETVSPTCSTIFLPLIDYFCFGCHSKQAQYVDEKAKTITICSSFALTVWGPENQNSKTNMTYDNCGLKVNNVMKIQSVDYKKIEDFFNDIKPPYFEDYTVIISDKNDPNYCFDNAYFPFSLALKYLGLLLIVLFI